MNQTKHFHFLYEGYTKLIQSLNSCENLLQVRSVAIMADNWDTINVQHLEETKSEANKALITLKLGRYNKCLRHYNQLESAVNTSRAELKGFIENYTEGLVEMQKEFQKEQEKQPKHKRIVGFIDTENL